MSRNILIIIVILLLIWITNSGNIPSLVDLGHKIAENLFPPVKH